MRWEQLRGRGETLKSSAEQLARLQTQLCEDHALPAEGVRCRAGHTAYWITAAGQMQMCGMIPLTAGSVPEQGFDRCWQNTRALMKTVTMPPQCAACRLRPVCCVCPAACFAETGGFTQAPPYLCEMSRAAAQELARWNKEEPDAAVE